MAFKPNSNNIAVQAHWPKIMNEKVKRGHVVSMPYNKDQKPRLQFNSCKLIFCEDHSSKSQVCLSCKKD